MAQFTPSRPAAMAGLLALAALASCKKDDAAEVAPVAPVVAPALTAPLLFPGIGNKSTVVTRISGTLVSLRTDVNYLIGTSPYLQSTRTESVQARFYPGSTPGGALSFEDGGGVSVNGIALDKQADNSYTKAAGFGLTGSSLLTSTTTAWRVAGAGGVPALAYAQPQPFPSYNGTPTQRRGTLTTRQLVLSKENTASANDVLDRADDLVLRLGSGVAAADSLYVIVSSGADAPVMVRIGVLSPGVDANGTVILPPTEVVMPAAALARLAPNAAGTAFLQTVAFRTFIYLQGGKTYAFVKAGVRVTPIKIR